MNHIHFWKVNDRGLGVCSRRGCPVKVRQFRDWQEPAPLYSWNAAGFNAGIHLPLPRTRINDEGYD